MINLSRNESNMTIKNKGMKNKVAACGVENV